MSWAIVGDCLAVAGLTLLTFGTGTQAWANLAEFSNLRASASEVADEAFKDAVGDLREFPSMPATSSMLKAAWAAWRIMAALLARRSIQTAVIFLPLRLAQLRAKGGEEAVQMARLIRLAEVWGILMVGSALALAAAAIQLALA
jgi:hypothetical protein